MTRWVVDLPMARSIRRIGSRRTHWRKHQSWRAVPPWRDRRRHGVPRENRSRCRSRGSRVTKAFSIPETRSSRLKLRTIVPAQARPFFFSGWPEADEETYCSRLAWHAGLDSRVENSILNENSVLKNQQVSVQGNLERRLRGSPAVYREFASHSRTSHSQRSRKARVITLFPRRIATQK